MIIERRVSIFDVEAPFVMSNRRLDRLDEELGTNKTSKSSMYSSINHISPMGNFIGDKPKWLRFEVDSRHLPDIEFASILTIVFAKIK